MGKDRKITSVHPGILHCDFEKEEFVKYVARKQLMGNFYPSKLLVRCLRISGCFCLAQPEVNSLSNSVDSSFIWVSLKIIDLEMLNALTNSPLNTEFPLTANGAGRSCAIGKCNSILLGPSSTGTAVFPTWCTDRQWCPRVYLIKTSKNHPSYCILALSICSSLGKKKFGAVRGCFSLFPLSVHLPLVFCVYF